MICESFVADVYLVKIDTMTHKIFEYFGDFCEAYACNKCLASSMIYTFSD